MDDLLHTSLADPERSADFVRKYGPAIWDRVKNLLSRVNRREARIQPDNKYDRGEAIERSELFAEYAQYTQNPEKRAIIRVGLIMRELQPASAEMDERRVSLRAKGESALHLAELVQSDVLRMMLRELRGQGMTEADFRSTALDLMENVDKYAEFVQTHAEESIAIMSAIHKIRGSFPRIFVILAGGYATRDAAEIAKKVRDNIPVSYTAWHQSLGRYREAFVFLYDPKGVKLGELEKAREEATGKRRPVHRGTRKRIGSSKSRK